MRFLFPSAVNRLPSVLPLLGVSALPALIVLAMTCFSLSREEEVVRLPTGSLPRPPRVAESPVISVRLSQQGAVTLAGERIANGSLAAAWQRERAAVRLLGFEPSQAMVIIQADRDLPTANVQTLMETAHQAGFTQCVLRPADVPPPSANAQGPKP